MTPEKWDVYLPKVAGDATDNVCRNPQDLELQQRFVDIFQEFLPTGRVLAPGAVTDAVMLVEAGYDVHALVLGEDNVRWLEDVAMVARLHIRNRDAHDLDYPANFFDGYFTVQVHEHWISPYVHVGEVRYCMRDGGIVFVDACGTTNPDMRQVWHVNLAPEQQVKEQWEYWGFKERWRGTSGDERPQFVFEKLPAGHPEFKNSNYVDRIMRARAAL